MFFELLFGEPKSKVNYDRLYLKKGIKCWNCKHDVPYCWRMMIHGVAYYQVYHKTLSMRDECIECSCTNAEVEPYGDSLSQEEFDKLKS